MIIFIGLLTVLCVWLDGTRKRGVVLAVTIGTIMLCVFMSKLPHKAIGIASLCLLLAGAGGEAYLLYDPHGHT